MRWRFTLIDYTINAAGVTTVLNDEPVGWDDCEIKIARDKKWHGIFIDYSVNKLGFTKQAYSIIKAAYDNSGAEANTELLIEIACDDDDSFAEFYLGRLVYPRIKIDDQDYCLIEIPVEQSGCFMTWKNRYDQQVDLQATTTMDGTALNPYDGIETEVELYGKPLPLTVETFADEQYILGNPFMQPWRDTRPQITICPEWQNVLRDEFETVNSITASIDSNPNPPDVLFANPSIPAAGGIPLKYTTFTTDCEMQNEVFVFLKIDADIELDVTVTADAPFTIYARLYHVDAGGGVTNFFDIDSYSSNINVGSQTFNLSGTNSARWTVGVGDAFYVTFFFDGVAGSGAWTVNQAILNFPKGQNIFRASVFETCPSTINKLSLINEALSRATEIISDDCLRVFSNYFGRTDAEPYASIADGCGSLESITNGLFLRRANRTDGSENKLFVSMEQLFDGLNSVHNIGIGLEEDPNRAGFNMLRIEPAEYFYSSTILLECNGPKEFEISFDEKRAIALLNIGYKKWETEYSGGLDEFLTKREYRTELTQVNTKVNQLSNFIASGYAIEVTRRQNTTEDYKYDNDIFIICLERGYGGFAVELFEALTVDNVLSNSTIYNIRISPVRNLMRWYKTARTVASSRFKFNAGDGNYIAELWATNADSCLPETQSSTLAENNNISANNFKDSAEATPIWLPQLIKFKYPLTFQEFNTIRANPTGTIRVTKGDKDLTGYIDEISYNPEEGLAKFTLLSTWS